MASSWSFDPLIVLTAGVASIAYGRGLLDLRRVGGSFMSWWRPWAFYLGSLAALLALISPIDALSERMFLFHMVQHLLLVFVAAPLILLGAPLLPITRGLPAAVRRNTMVRGARSHSVRWALRYLSHPMIAWSVFVVTLWSWHMPPLYTAAIENQGVHVVEHVAFMGTALLFWWLIIDPTPFRARIPYLGRFVYVLLALTQSLPLAAMLTFASEPWYEPYTVGAGLWGIGPLEDQQIGGLIMWIGGMITYFIAVASLFVVAMKKDEEETDRRQMALAAGPASVAHRVSNG